MRGETLGSGSFGTVYQVDEKMVAKFGNVSEGELEALSALKHTGIVPEIIAAEIVPNFIEDEEDMGWILMSRATGKAVYNNEPSPALTDAYWEARKKIHLAGVAHLDMHGGNFLYSAHDSKGTVVDFGLAIVDWVVVFLEAVAGVPPERGEYRDNNIPTDIREFGPCPLEAQMAENFEKAVRKFSRKSDEDPEHVRRDWKEASRILSGGISTTRSYWARIEQELDDFPSLPDADEAKEIVEIIYGVSG
jgi:serine/threonine protein kinase